MSRKKVLTHKHAGHLGECAECAVKDDPKKQAAAEDQEREWFTKYGFFIHYVPNSGDWVNVHTHGIADSFQHVDLQIVFPITPQQAISFMHGVVDEIKKGRKFLVGDRADILKRKDGGPAPFTFSDAEEQGRRVLRVLIPDHKGRAPGDPGCEWPFTEQPSVVVQ